MFSCYLSALKELVRLRTNLLENRNTNISKACFSNSLEVTMQLSHTCPEPVEWIYEAFSNFRLVAQIREEIEKVKMSRQIVII